MSQTPVQCANCGAMLFKEWFDWNRRAYECRVCHALTGPTGELQEGPPAKGQPRASRIDRRALWFLVAAGAALVLIFVAQQNL